MDQLHGDWAEKKSYPPLSSLRPASNLESVKEEPPNTHQVRAQSCKPPNRHSSPYDFAKSQMYSSSAQDLKHLPAIAKSRSVFDQGYGSGTINSRSSNKSPNVYGNNGNSPNNTSKYSEKPSPMALAMDVRSREQSLPVRSMERRDSRESSSSNTSGESKNEKERRSSNSSDEIQHSKSRLTI